MRTAAETKTVNHFLRNRGFSATDEPGALMQQMAFCVRDHDHFRSMLTACEPEQRSAMYRALAPNLNFEARPLDVYISEAGAVAEAKQLPTLGEGGKLLPFKTPTIESDEFIANEAIKREAAKHHLRVTCAKCTREETFSGIRKIDAIKKLRDAGWTYNEATGTGREICPKCPGGKAN